MTRAVYSALGLTFRPSTEIDERAGLTRFSHRTRRLAASATAGRAITTPDNRHASAEIFRMFIVVILSYGGLAPAASFRRRDAIPARHSRVHWSRRICRT